MRRLVITLLFISGLALLLPSLTYALPYGSGAYGTCQYETCSITLDASETVSINATPSGASMSCTTANHAVSVSTGATTGYTLQLSSTDASNSLTRSGGGTVSATSGTPASPVTLTANQWGYRVDGLSSFGSGTVTQTNVSSLTNTYAGVPVVSAPQTIRETSAAADEEITTTWYGICVDASIPAGTYSDGITYTAIINN